MTHPAGATADAGLDAARLPGLRGTIERATLHYWRDYALAAGEVVETPELSFFAAGVPLAAFNRVTWTRLSADGVEDRIDAVQARFADRATPFRWYVADDSRPADLGARLKARGFHRAGTGVPMVLDLEALPASLPVPDGVHVTRVRTRQDQACFAAVLAPVFTPDLDPPPFAALEAALPLGLYDAKPRYLATVDGVPAATSVLVEADGVAGIHAVATVPAFRGRGVGTLVTLLPLLEARARGHRLGVLQASAMGEPVYRRIGFEAIGMQHIYTSPAQGTA